MKKISYFEIYKNLRNPGETILIAISCSLVLWLTIPLSDLLVRSLRRLPRHAVHSSFLCLQRNLTREAPVPTISDPQKL